MVVPLASNAALVEIFNRIADLPLGVPVMDEVALQRDKRQAEQWSKKDPGIAHAALGTIATLQGHEESMRDHYQIALSHEPQNATLKANHINALVSFGYCSEAADLADQYCIALPLFKVLYIKAIFANLAAGRIQKAASWLDAWDESVFGTFPYNISDLIQCKNFLATVGIPDAEVEDLQREATDFLRERKLQIIGTELHFHEDEYDQWISLSYILWLTVEQGVHLEIAHAMRKATKDPTRASECVVVTFTTEMTP
ncbi:MAG: hypothetical protein H7839_03925 [Magnetococcus sp. YQC-5]